MFRFIVFLISLAFISQANAALLSPRTYNKLNDIQQSINEQPNLEARLEIAANLLELAEDLEGNSLGLALTWQTHAQLHLLDERYREANEYLARAIKLKGLDSATLFQLKSFYAQTLFIEEKYAQVINVLESVVAADDFKESAAVYSLLAAAYYSIDNFNDGLPHIVKACELASKPKEAWLQMAFSGYYQQKNYSQALVYTNQLVLNFPDKKDYWQQKAGMHQLVEDYASAASSKELSYKKGFIVKASDYLNLGQLLASQGNPYKVATALEKALAQGKLESTEKTLRLMQQAWMQAKEMDKARAALHRLFIAFKQQKDGIRLMHFLVDAQYWQQAIAIGKELYPLKLTQKQKGSVLLLDGICQYRLGNTRFALNALSKAMAIKTSSSQAKGWMSYIKQLQQG
ncbi:hypothetical protein A9Q73_07225 [Bermanella sp. 47_1433_sub80_T6]|nr:hypothetical protein A9Q73_07225 [Bermanella sp. 47_1433_sub80_T6]